MHRLRTARLAALLVGLAMVAAGCGGGGDEGGGTHRRQTASIKEGGTLSYASDQEQAGFNPNTAKDNLFALSSIVTGIYPSVFNIHPDFTVQLDPNFMDSAELTNEDPQTVVYKIKQDAVWSDGTPVTADDFIFWWENCNETDKKADCVSTTGYKDIESVKRVRRRQDGHHRLQEQVQPTGSRSSRSTSSRPTTARSSRAAGTPASTRTPRRSPRPARTSSTPTPRART